MNRKVLKTLNEVEHWLGSFLAMETNLIIGFDTETTSLDYLTQELVGISFCFNTNSCYIDIIDNPEKEGILDFLRNFFKYKKIDMLIGHNISYDLKVLGKYNIYPHPDCKLFCTQTAAHLINENLPKNLTFLAGKYLSINLKSWNKVKMYGWHSQEFYNYGTEDAESTYKLFQIQYPLLKLQNLTDLFFNVEMPFLKVKIDLETHGILIDKEKLDELKQEMIKIISDLKIKMCDAGDIEYWVETNLMGQKEMIISFNFNSSQQLVNLITNKLNLEIKEQTDNGNPSTSEKSLKQINGQHPFIDLLLQYKKATKLSNAFVEPFHKFIDSDGRIRCSWQNTIAVTGRIICSNPNLLQLPRKNDLIEIPYEFRSCFIAPKGKKIVSMDYVGQELCWLAEVTQDQNLINTIKEGKDLHLTTAKTVFNLDIPDECLKINHPDYPMFKKKYKKQRHIGKNGINFPLIYGKSSYGIAKDFNITEEEAKRWIDSFFSLYPDVKKSIAACHKQIDETGEVTDWFGRKRRLLSDFPTETSTDISNKYRAYRQGFNFLVQSPSASQMKLAATNVKNLFDAWNKSNDNWEAKTILMIYDELVYEINEEYAEVSADFVRDEMEDCVKTSVPFTIEAGIGQNYAETKM